MSIADPLSVIPADRRPAVDRAIAAAFGTTPVARVALFAGGLSSALVYRIDISDQPYVLRLVQEADSFNDPARQFHCMRIAADHGVAPRVVYTDAGDAVSITEFVNATQWTPMSGMSRDDLRRRLAGTIRAIHALPPFPPARSFFDVVDGFVARYQAAPTLPADETDEHLRLFARVQQVYPRHDPDLVSSHNDLNPTNVLVEGERIWVIDWEVASRNDRYFDLASAANYYLIDTPAEEFDYLTVYFGDTPDDYERARFYLMRQICRALTAMVFLSLASARTPPGAPCEASADAPTLPDLYARIGSGDVVLGSAAGQLLYARALLAELLRSMGAPRFEESVQLIEKRVQH